MDPIVWNLRPEVFPGLALPRWYGLIFASGFLGGFFVFRWMLARERKPAALLDSLLVYVVVGTIVGMRLGHTLLYQPDVYLRDPLRILMLWEGGYASHGGFLGVLVTLFLFARKHPDLGFFWIADRIAICAMLTAGMIRIGNFANSEMYGHVTSVPWAIVFANVDALPRHPTQLYEAAGYLGVFGLSLAIYAKNVWVTPPGRLLGVVMALASTWRLVVEFFKEDQVAFESGMLLNMGQLLSLPYILMGVALALGLHARLLRKL